MNAKNSSITTEPKDVQVATSLAVLAKVQAEAVKPDAVEATSEIDLLIRRFYADKDAWSATADEDGDLIADGPEYENSWASCKDLIRYQCRTDEDVRRKVTAILENGWLRETAEIGFDDEPFNFGHFLKTLIVPATG